MDETLCRRESIGSSAGPVDVIATVGSASSKKNPPADQFTYH
jgi:hypothetical protein